MRERREGKGGEEVGRVEVGLGGGGGEPEEVRWTEIRRV